MGPEIRLASLVAWSAQLSSSLSMASSQVAKGAPSDTLAVQGFVKGEPLSALVAPMILLNVSGPRAT